MFTGMKWKKSWIHDHSVEPRKPHPWESSGVVPLLWIDLYVDGTILCFRDY